MKRIWIDSGPDVAVMLVALAGLFILHLVAVDLSTPAVLGVWLILALVQARGLYVQARARRRLLLHAHVRFGSPLQRYLSGRLLMTLRTGLQAALLSALLLPFVIRLDQTAAWQLLLLHLPLAALARSWLGSALERHLSEHFLPLARWRFWLGLNLCLLVPLLALVSLYGRYPDLQESSLMTAISGEVALQQAQSELLLAALQFHAALDAGAWWLAQQLVPVAGLQVAGWLLLFGVKALFLWSYLLYLAGTLTLAMETRAWWRRNDGAD